MVTYKVEKNYNLFTNIQYTIMYIDKEHWYIKL